MNTLIKKTATCFIVICVVFSTFSFEPVMADSKSPKWPNDTVKTKAKSSCLIDYNTGTVLYEHDSHKHRFPASITKTLTTLLTIENCNLNDTVTYSKHSVACIKDGAASIGAVPGEKMSVRDCLYGLMLHSGNECATALGEHMFGSEKTFAKKLNERAKQAGAKDSHFVNGNGLHNDNHYVTAYDMAMIMRAALKYPLFRDIIGTTQYTIQKNNKRKHRFIASMRHKMIWKGGPYYYKGIIGGKTGFTDQSGNTLVTAAERNGLTLVAVVLKSDTNHVYTDTKKLFDYGFSHFKSLNVSQNDKRFNSDNDYSLESPFVKKVGTLELDTKATVVIPKGAKYSDLEISPTYNISRGTFSNLTYHYDGKSVGNANLTYHKAKKVKKSTSSEEEPTIEKQTTVAPTTTGTPASKKVFKSISNNIVLIIIVAVCLIMLIVLLVLIVKRKKKINRIRQQKRNRNRYTH